MQRLSSIDSRWLDMVLPSFWEVYLQIHAQHKDPDSISSNLLYVPTCISYVIGYMLICYMLIICVFFFDILRLDTCECQSHYRAVNCEIVRSSWSQMKRPRWSLITGAAWCWLMFWSQPLHHQDARCLPAKVGVYNKFLITHTVWELTSTSSWGRRNHKSCNIIATLGG